MERKELSFLVDACVNRDVVDYLKSHDYRVMYVNDIVPSMSDHAVKNLGYKNDSIILTKDKTGFTDYRLAYLMGYGDIEELQDFLFYMIE